MYGDAELQTAREKLVSYCGRMVADGLAVGAAGNSADVADTAITSAECVCTTAPALVAA